MIKTDRQYQAAVGQAERFRDALRVLDGRSQHDQLHELERAALASQLESIEREVHEYDALRQGVPTSIEIESFEQLAQTLIKARIASGLTQRELAQRLRMKEQQIQRYEANEYAGASLRRVQEVAAALGLRVRNEVLLPHDNQASRALRRQLRQAGLDNDLIDTRLMPSEGTSAARYADLAALVGRILRAPVEAVLGAEPLQPSLAPALAPSFKVPANASEARLTAYALYARYLAEALLRASAIEASERLPAEWKSFRSEVTDEYGTLTFANSVSYLWANGVAVLPLRDRGAFHAAYWRIDGRDVIVVKQSVRSTARWLFDLLHEVKHAASTEERERAVIEEPSALDVDAGDDEELAANQFAGDVLLDGAAEALAQEAVTAAGGRLQRLKAAALTIAERHNVDVGALANYLAWRLSLQGEDWWGAAHNLQSLTPDPWEQARDELFRHVDLDRLDVPDRGLLLRALSGGGDR